jgi:rare lipoprotein A
MHKLTAAHRTLPLGSVAVVRSLTNGRQVTVRINDRGPFARGRILDLSYAGALAMGMVGPGTDEIELRVVGYQGQTGRKAPLRLQVASFADPANAQALARQLSRSGYPGSTVVAIDLPEGRRYRVYTGRFAAESTAERAAVQLKRVLDTDAFVIRDDLSAPTSADP